MAEKEFKKDLYHYCLTFVNDRIKRVRSRLHEVRIALGSETKSSAGDKHETGRAMHQLEMEKLGQQLAGIEKTREILARVDIEVGDRPLSKIALGSLVKTSKATYFLAISAGKYQKGNQEANCISTVSPIGKLLLGKTVEDIVTFKGEEIKIINIL